MLDLIVSIVNHNSVEPLRACLQSVLASDSGITCEVYVVDNLCENRAESMLREEFPQVKVIVNSHTLGFGANHNQVLKQTASNSRYVLILNPDTVVSYGAIRYMVEFMDSHERVAICGPRLIDELGSVKTSVRKALSLWKDAVLLGLYISGTPADLSERIVSLSRRLRPTLKAVAQVGAEDSGIYAQQGEVKSCETLNGSCMLIRTKALRQIGLFDERFFLYFEETDLCLRARLDGWEITYLPGVDVLHSGAYSTKPQYHRYLSVFARSCLSFYRKHQGPAAVWVLRISILGAVAANLIRWTVHYAVRPSRRGEAVAWLAFSKSLTEIVCQRI